MRVKMQNPLDAATLCGALIQLEVTFRHRPHHERPAIRIMDCGPKSALWHEILVHWRAVMGHLPVYEIIDPYDDAPRGVCG